MSINPFSYGKPIDDPARFIGHRRELEQVYSRLLSAFESSSIVGERRIGKTSLLKVLGHPDIQTQFGLDLNKYTFIYQDFQFLESDTKPTRFWQRVLRSIRRAVKDQEDVVEEIELALKAETIDNYTLDDIFSLVDEAELNIVLLLDEFENVTRNRNFDDDFFAGLRALAIHHNLALVTSSREELVKLTHSEKVRSSPFFNIFASINLRPFSETDATALIDTYLTDAGVKFLLSEFNLIFGVAGYHPYFLQMACHHLFAVHQQGLDDAARRQFVLDKMRSETEPIFQDYWQNSNDAQKILLIVMAMRTLEQQVGKDTLAELATAGGGDYSLRGPASKAGEDTVTNLERFYLRAGQAVEDLERRGLVVKNPETSGYYLFSNQLSELIAEEITGEVDDLRGWRDWQKDESLTGILPLELQETLSRVVHRLNPAYRVTLGRWLLEPATAAAALALVENFTGHQEKYKRVAAPPPEELAAAAVEAQAVESGTAPQGLFARVTQRLESKDVDAAVELNLDNAIQSLDKQQQEQMIYSLKRQLVRYTGNLNKLMEDAATYGSLSSAPLKLQNEIEEIEQTIADLQAKLNLLEQQP